VVPVVGALVPVFSFIFGYIFLNESLSERQFLAFIILVVGGILISVKHTRFYYLNEVMDKFRNIFGNVLGGIRAEYNPTRRLLFNSAASALLFAGYYVLIKYVYTYTGQPFIGSFVWSRLGTFIGVIFILFVPYWRQLIIKHQEHARKPGNYIFFLAIRLLAALAFIMLNWAISLGNVALINSLQGVQYLFLILLVVFLSARFPKILREELGGGVMMQKLIGTVLICVGLYMLVIPA
jgi:drug/metabolite transporter (DMT)-like permease